MLLQKAIEAGWTFHCSEPASPLKFVGNLAKIEAPMKFLRISLALLVPLALLAQKASPKNAVTELQAKINSGQVKLEFDAKHGYLSSLLKSFNIPVSSQSLVFSKSSFQLQLISPDSPRAIYFNDETYVSWTQGASDLEIGTMDPKEGPVFFLLAQARTAAPKFQGQDPIQCLVCHDFGESSTPVPRLLMLSVLPDNNGSAIGAASLITNDQSPFRERWGGWYVTGTHGKQRHLGNMIVHEPAGQKVDIKEYAAHADLSAGANVTDLSSHFDTSRFLTPGSDIVALMLLGHQTHIHNLMVLAAKRSASGNRENMEKASEYLVKAMLFSEAEPFTDPVKGTSSFADDFSKQGPRDSQGRSLRQLDLQHRLLRYPMSYLIYSKYFDALPADVKAYVFRRFREVLTGQDKSPEFAHLTAQDRAAILQILKETKPGI